MKIISTILYTTKNHRTLIEISCVIEILENIGELYRCILLFIQGT